MKTTTTTREYDDEGRMTRETIVEQETAELPTSIAQCSCGWSTVCPVHPLWQRYTQPYRWTCGTTTTGTYIINSAPHLSIVNDDDPPDAVPARIA
jgi:hypothetical protein